MSHRRIVAAQQPPQPAPPIEVVWAEPPRLKPGVCPKCGQFFGRLLRGHTKWCDGEIERPA